MVKEGRERGNGESEGVMTISIGGRLQEDVGKDSWRRGRTKGRKRRTEKEGERSKTPKAAGRQAGLGNR